jgi:choloylglycine hydrolase
MKCLRFYTTAAFLLTLLSFQADLKACTGIKLTAKDQSIVHGRTLEFGVEIDTSIVVVPRGYEFTGSTMEGPGMTYTSKYATVGAIAFNKLSIMDGLNEKGLAAGIFYFPEYAGYTTITAENRSKALGPDEFVNWILTQFSTVEEVKSALSNVVIAPTVVKAWGASTPPPFHYIVYDKNGKSLVIEPINGKLVTHDSKLNVFTNAPTFDWHKTNLRNYINLRAVNAEPLNIEGVELAPLGQGSGLLGLPGDFTPPSRFVRAAIFCFTAIPSENSFKAAFQAFHILNQFDIPVGAIREVIDNVVHTDYTMITCVRDPQSLKYYYRTYNDQTIRMVDLNKFDFDAKTVKKLTTKTTAQQQAEQYVDETAALK